MTNDNHTPDIEAVIEAKIEAALLASGRNPSTLSAEEIEAIQSSIVLTPEEMEWATERQLLRIVQIEIGRRVIQVLNEHCRVAHEDLIPSLTTYFEAVAEGEVEAA